MTNQSHDLYKLPNGEYLVLSFKLKKPYRFLDVEGAAEALEMIGIPDEQIDQAIADMHVKGDTHAQFGVMQGFFIYSDKEEPPVDLPPPPKAS
jgi:hypothetical protein